MLKSLILALLLTSCVTAPTETESESFEIVGISGKDETIKDHRIPSLLETASISLIVEPSTNRWIIPKYTVSAGVIKLLDCNIPGFANEISCQKKPFRLNITRR